MRKPLFLALGAFLASTGLMAQNVLYSEDFESGTMPSNIILHNEDGLTPHANVSAITDAWIVAPVDGNNAAASTSWYTPAGQADDWMVIPGITISNPATFLTWRSTAISPDFPDGYEVLISTTGTDPGDFTNAPVFSVASDAASWGEHVVDLSSYAGSSVNIAFRNTSNDMYVLAIDDINVLELNDHDAELVAISTEKYHEDGASVDINGTIKNNGANTITSIDVKWSDGTNTFSETMSVNIASLTTVDFTHSDAFTIPNTSTHNISVWVELANDADLSNDQVDIDIVGVTYLPTRVVVGEEGTGTWCGWCPRGAVFMEYMADNYPDQWIGIAVHNSDPMVNSTYDSWMAGQISGYPSALASRQLVVDPSGLEAAYESIVNDFAFADIEVEANMAEDRTVSVEISAEFAADVNEELRFAAVVIEDEVTGTGSDWSQANYYSGGASGNLSGAGHDWHDAPDPVPAEDMVYEDVAREILGGIEGESGSIPSSITAGDVVTHSFTHSLSTDYNEEHIRVAVLMIQQETGYIVNAAQAILAVGASGDTTDSTVGVIGLNGAENITVFPNPAQNQLNIQGISGFAQVSIFDMTGRLVLRANTESKTVDVSALRAGSYSVKIKNEGLVATKRIQVVR